MNAIQAFVPPKIVQTFSAFLEFCYIARQNVITEDSLEQLSNALHKFHDARQVFLGTACEDDPSALSLPRQHAMVHYYDNIKKFGSPNGLCSSITESKHISAVKRPWRRSNKHEPLVQMLRSNDRLDKLAAARADFSARSMLENSCLTQAIMDCDDEDSVDDVRSDSGSASTDTDTDTEPDTDTETHPNYTSTLDPDTTIYNFDDTNAFNTNPGGHTPLTFPNATRRRGRLWTR